MKLSEALLAQGEALFSRKEYKLALEKYSRVLSINPYDKTAKILAVLTEMAMSNEDGAEALYEYYSVLKAEEEDEAEDILEALIDSLDNRTLELSKILDEPIKRQLMYENGISYDEFKEVIVKEFGFKKAYESVMFSTKVIITNKKDFIDFLEELIKHEFYSSAIGYLETSIRNFPNNYKIQELLIKATEENVKKQALSNNKKRAK
jgi:tetratricopeptide (TPR) repeat protein